MKTGTVLGFPFKMMFKDQNRVQIKKGTAFYTGSLFKIMISRSLFHCVNDCFECFWFIHCQVSKHFTVQTDVLCCQFTH